MRQADGTGLLRCTRANGSVRWQRQPAAQAGFYARHDLTHYAVESTLGLRRGFFGLVAGGWDIADTSGKGARGPLPPEAILVEHLVGLLDVERATGVDWSAADLAEQLVRAGVDQNAVAAANLTDDRLGRVRAHRAALLAQWSGVPAGGTLALSLD